MRLRGKLTYSFCVGVFYFILTLISFSTRAQQRSVRFNHLTIEDGLPQNMVDCMLQDSQGFMWFGTWNGLCRYDGYSFEVFSSENSLHGTLGSNFIYDLEEDSLGNIWVATRQGLYVFLYDDFRFVPADSLSGTGTGIHGAVRTLTIQQNKMLWVGTDKGLFQFEIGNKSKELTKKRVILFGAQDGQLRGSTVNDLLIDQNDRLWIGTDAGVSLFSFDHKNPEYFEHENGIAGNLSSDHVQSIYQSAEGIVWIGTEYGLNKFVPSSGSFVQFFANPADPETLAHNTVMDMTEDVAGNLYVGTLGGLSILPAGKNEFVSYKYEHLSDHSLNNDFINCLLRDKNGDIWLGTERGGVNLFNAGQNSFEHFEYKMNESNSLSHSTINSIFEDETYLWIGTAGGGLNRYEKSTGKFRHFRQKASDEHSISSDFITSIYRDVQGRLWVGTWGSGLNRMEHEEGNNPRFIQYQQQDYPELVSNFISSLAEDNQGNLWIGTLGGLIRYDTRTSQFGRVLSHKGDRRISEVGCLMFQTDMSLWVGTRNGLFNLHFEDSTRRNFSQRYYEQDPDNPHSLSGNYVISMARDQDNRLWFGTYGQGINGMRISKDSVWFDSYQTRDGLSNNIIYGILPDAQGSLWLSTDFGLSRFDPKEKEIRNFFIADGLLNNQYYWSSAFRNGDGKMYFGGMNGLDAFYPEWIREEDQTSEMVITDIRLLNESVQPGREYNGVEVLRKRVSEVKEIYLSYKEKILGIEFSSLNYQEPGMIRYAYILEELENEWNFVSSNRRYASYTNLTPGDYVFKVKATSPNGDFDTPPRELIIHIAPPFWDTAWFRIIVVILVIGLLFGYIRLRTYTLKRQKLLLEREVKHRTDRINHQNEALSFQAIQLQQNNHDLEEKQGLIEGQNNRLENQNKEILTQRDELITLNKKLKQVSQLKLSFFTNISHEFRTPLTLIIGPIEKLLRENHLNQEVKNTIQIMERNAQRLLHLINQIMDFRKIEKGRMELKVGRGRIDVFCRNVFQAFHPLSEMRSVTFTYEEKELPPEVWFDPEKIENIMYNLLSNAFKYTPPGGKVHLCVEGLAFENARLNGSDQEGKCDQPVIRIVVTDTGIGISEENLPLVFKRFYRIESEDAFKISGSGIGLALTEELIKSHLGEIFVESHPGKGSVFEVQFPCLRDSYAGSNVVEKPVGGHDLHLQVEWLKNEFISTDSEITSEGQAIDKSRPTLLVVEDNADLRQFIIHRLQHNYNVLEASNGEEGIRLAGVYNPEVVISDVMMPRIDGLQLCATLKNNLATSHIPIVLLTAKSAIEDQLQGLEIGADDYLPKPFNFEVLEKRLHNLIESRRMLRLHYLQNSNLKMDSNPASSKDQQFLAKAITTVKKHMEESDFGAREFVGQMGISKSLLHKKLTSLTGQSAAEFINHLRMKRAMKLLRKNEQTISEIAYHVGYNDPKYFTRLFSRYYGESPSEYLKKLVAVD